MQATTTGVRSHAPAGARGAHDAYDAPAARTVAIVAVSEWTPEPTIGRDRLTVSWLVLVSCCGALSPAQAALIPTQGVPWAWIGTVPVWIVPPVSRFAGPTAHGAAPTTRLVTPTRTLDAPPTRPPPVACIVTTGVMVRWYLEPTLSSGAATPASGASTHARGALVWCSAPTATSAAPTATKRPLLQRTGDAEPPSIRHCSPALRPRPPPSRLARGP